MVIPEDDVPQTLSGHAPVVAWTGDSEPATRWITTPTPSLGSQHFGRLRFTFGPRSRHCMTLGPHGERFLNESWTCLYPSCANIQKLDMALFDSSTCRSMVLTSNVPIVVDVAIPAREMTPSLLEYFSAHSGQRICGKRMSAQSRLAMLSLPQTPVSELCGHE